MIRTATFVLALFTAAPAFAIEPGRYLCSVEQRAGIGSVHLENAGPPEGFATAEFYRFRLDVMRIEGGQFRVVELPYDGADKSAYQWEDDNSTLHAPYVGGLDYFREVGGPGFLYFYDGNWAGQRAFYHAGFERAGGEDESLSVRWGRCMPEGR